jgi:hypothetical protein
MPHKAQASDAGCDPGAKKDLLGIIEPMQPMTVRQVFYQAVSRGLIDKTESEYQATICRLLLQMRREGLLPHDWIADGTRWMRKPKTFSSLMSMMRQSHRAYRRAIWDDQHVYVEFWCEKDAIAGILSDVTFKWDVPLMAARGFSSETFLYSAATNISYEGKPAFIYHFGDRDPSGVLIDKQIERGLRRYAPDSEITFKRVAVTEEQIEQYGLPTRPTKRKGNTHAKNFKGESIEVDAIDADRLRELAEECIVAHVDQAIYGRMLQVEKAERETLLTIAKNLEGLQ